MGDGAIKKLARRKLDSIDSNVASYSRILNDEAQLEHLKESKALNEMIALLNEERQVEQEKRAAEKAAKFDAKMQMKVNMYHNNANDSLQQS